MPEARSSRILARSPSGQIRVFFSSGGFLAHNDRSPGIRSAEFPLGGKTAEATWRPNRNSKFQEVDPHYHPMADGVRVGKPVGIGRGTRRCYRGRKRSRESGVGRLLVRAAARVETQTTGREAGKGPS